MNLTNNPTVAAVRDLLMGADDERAHHILWVDTDGEVHLDVLTGDDSPASWTTRMANRIRLRYETFSRGNGLTGPAAAQDSQWVRQVHEWLISSWNEGRRGYMGYPTDGRA